MNEPPVSSEALAQENLTAGQILRKARQARGLHIAALATSIKVLPRKLELLEADRYDELLDATFTRALAQTVCRSLKIDPAPVLALLPKAPGALNLDHVKAGLNAPFRDRPGRPSRLDSKSWGKGVPLQLWLPVLLMLGALAVYLSPADFHPWRALKSLVSSGDAVEVAAQSVELNASSATDSFLATSTSTEVSTATPATVVAPLQPASAADASPALPNALLELRVSKDSWIEVHDGNAKPLLARLVTAQEVIALNGTLPLRLKVGNASSTSVRFRGELVDLTPLTRDNVARLELK